MNDTLAGASPVDQPVRLDPERLAFEDWADERWGREACRHKSDTSGEWEAWRAATVRPGRGCENALTVASSTVTAALGS